MTTTTRSPKTVMLEQVGNAALPTWHRLGCLAWMYADRDGHARFSVGQVGTELGLNTKQVSEALVVARRRGWVDDVSTSRCLVLPGFGDRSCDERHRHE